MSSRKKQTNSDPWLISAYVCFRQGVLVGEIASLGGEGLGSTDGVRAQLKCLPVRFVLHKKEIK
jgi:hypothetical protein